MAARPPAKRSSTGPKPKAAARTRKAAAPESSAKTRPVASTKPKAGAKPTRPQAPAHRWWIVPAIVTAFIGLFVWTYYPVAAVQYRETREAARLRAELEHLTARNDRLRAEVDRLKTPAGVEDYARSQLGLVKKGENVVVVVDGNEAQEASAAAAAPRIDSDEAVAAPVGPWTAFLDLVFRVR